MSAGRFEYTIGFKTDNSGLKQTMDSLKSIQNITTKTPGFSDMSAEIAEAKKGAFDLEQALTRAFNPKMGSVNTTVLRNELSKLNLAEIRQDLMKMGPAGEAAFNQVAASAMKANLQIKQGNTLLTKFGNTLYRNLEWLISGNIISTVTGVFTKAYGFTKNLDSSLNDIRIVTGKSADEMARFGQEAQKTAMELGKGTTDITNASLIYFQQGLGEEEVKKRTEITAKMANVTGQSAETVADQMTAVWNGFQAGNEELERYADVMTKVAASTASSSAELAGAISKTASIAKITGVDMEQLTSMISTVISVTRDSPEAVGTAFKTIFARINDLVEDGTDEFGVSLGRVSSHLAAMGIEILNEDGTLKDLGTTITETGEKWAFYSREQQIAIAEQMGGKRQWGQILSLFDHWDDYKDTLLEATEATGSLDSQQEIYMDRVETHLQQVKTAWEGVYAQIFNEKDIITIADAIKKVLEGVETFLDTVGGFKPVLDMVITMMMQAFGPKMAQEVDRTFNNIKNVFANMGAEAAQRDITLMFGNLGDKGLLSELVEHQKTMNRYKDQLNEKDREQYSNYLKQKIALSEQTKELSKQVEEAKEFALARKDIGNMYTKAGGFDVEGFAPKDIEDRLKIIQELQQGKISSLSSGEFAIGTDVNAFEQMKTQRSNDISNLITQLQQYKQEAENVNNVNEKEIAGINKLINSLQGVKDTFDTATLNNEEFEKSLNKSTTAAEKAATQLLNLKNATPSAARDSVLNQVGVSGQGTNIFTQFREENNKMLADSKASIDTYKNLIKGLGDASILSADQVGALNAKLAQQTPDLEALKRALSEQLGVSEQGLENIMKVISQHSEGQLKVAEDTRRVLDNAQANMEKSLSFKDKLTDMTRMASLASQIAMSFNQIQNIGRIIQDEDIKGSEKIGRVLSSTAMMLPMIMSLFSRLMSSNTVKDIVESRGKKIEAEAALEKAAQKDVAANQARLKAEEVLQDKQATLEMAQAELEVENTRHLLRMEHLEEEKVRAMASAENLEKLYADTQKDYLLKGYSGKDQHKLQNIENRWIQAQAEGEAKVAQLEAETLAEEQNTTAKTKNIQANITQTESEIEKAQTDVVSTKTTQENTAKTLENAEANKIAAKEAQRSAIMRAAAVSLFVVALAALVIGIKKGIEAQEEFEETTKRNSEIIQEHIQSNQELIKSNQKVLASFQDYDKVWDSFKKGKATIDEVRASIDELAQSLGIEEDEEYLRLRRLAEYSGQYEALNEYLENKKRQDRIEQQLQGYRSTVDMEQAQLRVDFTQDRTKRKRFTIDQEDWDSSDNSINRRTDFETDINNILGKNIAAIGWGEVTLDLSDVDILEIPTLLDGLNNLSPQYAKEQQLLIQQILEELRKYLPGEKTKQAEADAEIWKLFSGERTEPIKVKDSLIQTTVKGKKRTLQNEKTWIFSGFTFDENTTEENIQQQLNDFALFYQAAQRQAGNIISRKDAYQIGWNWFMQTQLGAQDALTSIEYKNSIRDSINQTIKEVNKERGQDEQIQLIDENTLNKIEEKIKEKGLNLTQIDWAEVKADPTLLQNLTDRFIDEADIEKLTTYRKQINYLTQDYQALGSTIDNVIETIEKGNSSQDKILSSKDFESILEAEEELKLLFGGDNSEVAKAYDTIAQAQAGELSVYSDAFKEALKDIKQAMDDAEIEKSVQRFNKSWNEMIDSISSSATNVTHTTEDLSNALKELTDADYSIEVAIAVKNENLYQDLQKSYKEIVDTAEKIKENFVIDISDMDDLEEMFPGILEQAQIFSDGTVHLNQTIANSAMQAAQTEVESQKQALVDKLNLQKQELQGKVDLYDKIITAAEQIINDEEGKQEHLTAYKDLLNQLEEGDNKKSKAEQAKDNRDYYNKELENYKDASKANAEYWRIADENRAAYEERRGEYKTIENSKVYQDIMAQQFQENDVPGLDIDAFDDDFIKKLLGKNNSNFKAFKDALGDSLSQFKKNRQNLLDQISSIDSTLLKINTLDLATQNTLKHIGESTDSKKDNADATKEQTEAEAELLDLLNEEIDVYHDLNIAIKQVNNELSSLQKQEEKLTGDALTKNLEEQNKLLEQQIQNYQELARRKTADLVSTRSYLESQGMNFDENGNMMNHDEVILNKMEEVNNLRSEYNSLSAEEQEGFKERVEAAEEEYEILKKKSDLYDELQTDTIPQALADIAEAENKIIENNIKTFDLKFQIEFDKADAEKEYREFRNKVIKDLKEDDILGNTLASYEDLSYYRNIQGTGKIQILSQELSELQQARQDLAETGTSIFGDNAAAIEERIKSVTSELYKAQIEEKEAINAIENQYLDAIDTVGDKIKEQIDAYSKISDLIEHDINLIKLLYGEEAATEAVQKFQQQQEKQLWQQYDMYVKWSAQAQKEMNKVEIGSDAWKKWRSQWEEAQTGIRQSLEDIAQSIIDTYTTTIDTIYQKLDEKLGGALGLESMKSTYDFMQEQADKYLDTVNGAYAIEKLSKDMQDKINATDDIKAQQRLSELKDQEIKNLREKDKLTQYDVDRANALYDIEVKKIALKEAQQNKSKMRLRRDSQGNYSYQFVADEDSIATAAQELADAQNTLFNLDKDAYKNNLDEFYKLFTDFKEKQKQIYIDYADDAEKRQEALLQLEKTYGPAINDVIEQNANIRIKYEESAFEAIGELYDLNAEDLQNMADTEKDILMNQLVPNWTNGIQDMIGQIVGEGGFLAAIQESNAELEKNVYLFKKDLGNVENAAKEQFGNDIANGNDSIVNTMESLIDSNETIIAQWATLIDELKEIVNYVVTLSKTGIRVIEDGNIAENTTGQSTYSLNNNGYTQTTYNSINKNKSLNKTLKPKENLSPQAAQFLESAQNDPTWTKADIKQALNMINFVEAHNNQKDTSKQILDSISDKVRQNITALTRMLSFDKNSNIISSIGNEVKTEPASVQQNNYINADFPNAKDVYEILLAFETLQNQATQMAYTTRR